jgi:hypothetical protein
MKMVDHFKRRWGVGPWGVLAILTAFALTGMTVVRLKGPVMGFILPDDASNWLKWVVYIVVIFPIYQVFLLAYGALLGQFNFFWGKFVAIGRRLAGIRGRASG